MKREVPWLSDELAIPTRPDARIEERAYARGYRFVAGLDEAGRGPLAGPVVAAAVVFARGVIHSEIQDSKLLTAKKRETLAIWIQENALAWGLGIVESEQIDRLNILTASLLAMAEAAKKLRPFPDCLLIDGRQKIPLEFLKATGNLPASPRPPFADTGTRGTGETETRGIGESRLMPDSLYQRAIVKGDRRSVSIAAASILAKVARDEIMMEYHRIYPDYGFERHKGYASPSHLAAISRYGPSPIHRRSFKPVRELALGYQQSAFGRKEGGRPEG